VKEETEVNAQVVAIAVMVVEVVFAFA